MFGLLGIGTAYLLATLLFGPRVALVAAGFLAISPWHLQFSRIAFEAISLPPVLMLGAYALHRGLKDGRFLAAGAALFSLSTYCYPTAKVFAPLFLLGFGFLHADSLRRRPKAVACAILAAGLVASPNLFLVATNTQQERARQLLIFSANLENERAVRFLNDRDSGSSMASEILGHRVLLVPFVFAYNYLSYFLPDYLFLSGDPNLRHIPRGMGMCFWFYGPLLLAGLGVLLRSAREPSSRLILCWLALYPISASLTIESPHAIRTINVIPVLEIIAGLGLLRLVELARPAFASRSNTSRAALILTSAVIIAVPCEVVRYLIRYHREYPVYSGEAWSVGYREAFGRMEAEKGTYDTFYLSRRIDNGFLFACFLTPVDARELQRPGDLNERLRPYRYRIAWSDSEVRLTPRDAWLMTAQERAAHPDLRVLAQFPFPDGRPHLYLVVLPGS
jgi:hypothetical protein